MILESSGFSVSQFRCLFSVLKRRSGSADTFVARVAFVTDGSAAYTTTLSVSEHIREQKQKLRCADKKFMRGKDGTRSNERKGQISRERNILWQLQRLKNRKWS